MITVTKKVEYSLILISYLSHHSDNLSLRQISQQLNLPYSFLSKIATDLASAGIIFSREGRGGGYKLSPNWHQKSFYHLLVALGENKALVSCLSHKNCLHSSTCSLRRLWQKIESSLQQQLKTIKLSQIQ